MPETIRVLMLPSWYPTPEAPLLGTFYREQAQAMAARGAQVTVAYVNVGDDFRPSHNGITYTCDDGVHTYVYKRPNLTPRWERGRCFQRTRMLEKLYRRIEREQGRPDVVNLRSSLLGYEALSLCEAHDLPLFFMEHSSFVITEPDGSPMRRRLCAVMEKAAVNACVSTALKRVMAPFGETRVIPDMVDTGRFRQLFHHCFIGGMPGPVDKEIFYDLIKPGPALGRCHGLKHRFIINGFPESLLHQILSGGSILSHGGTPADQFVPEIPVKLFKHVTKYPFYR